MLLASSSRGVMPLALGLLLACVSPAPTARPDPGGVTAGDADAADEDPSPEATAERETDTARASPRLRAMPDDRDGDGVVDAHDACPELPESVDDEEDEDGCPERGDVVRVGFTLQLVGPPIRFETDSAEIQVRSFPLLDALADAIQRDPGIRLLEVGSHNAWDHEERWSYARSLSRDRGAAVVEGLVQRGVARERLRSAGYGGRCLLETRPSPRAYRRNQRSERTILVTAEGPTGAERGCAAAQDLVAPLP